MESLTIALIIVLVILVLYYWAFVWSYVLMPSKNYTGTPLFTLTNGTAMEAKSLCNRRPMCVGFAHSGSMYAGVDKTATLTDDSHATVMRRRRLLMDPNQQSQDTATTDHFDVGLALARAKSQAMGRRSPLIGAATTRTIASTKSIPMSLAERGSTLRSGMVAGPMQLDTYNDWYRFADQGGSWTAVDEKNLSIPEQIQGTAMMPGLAAPTGLNEGWTSGWPNTVGRMPIGGTDSSDINLG
jgi:hypothetical protein